MFPGSITRATNCGIGTALLLSAHGLLESWCHGSKSQKLSIPKFYKTTGTTGFLSLIYARLEQTGFVSSFEVRCPAREQNSSDFRTHHMQVSSNNAWGDARCFPSLVSFVSTLSQAESSHQNPFCWAKFLIIFAVERTRHTTIFSLAVASPGGVTLLLMGTVTRTAAIQWRTSPKTSKQGSNGDPQAHIGDAQQMSEEILNCLRVWRPSKHLSIGGQRLEKLEKEHSCVVYRLYIIFLEVPVLSFSHGILRSHNLGPSCVWNSRQESSFAGHSNPVRQWTGRWHGSIPGAR